MRRPVRRVAEALALLAAAGLCAGCCGLSKVYYDTMELFGKEKRHILTDRVKEGRENQEKAKQQFASAYDEFKAITGYQGGKLEEAYSKLKAQLDRSEARAEAVRDSIRSIDRVANDLFREWRGEIKQMKNVDLRRRSDQNLAATRARYDQLIAAMRRSSEKMEPVLVAFRDHVLFLKHNLNAQAIASLQGQVGKIGDDVAILIRDMEASIREADAFIQTMGTQ